MRESDRSSLGWPRWDGTPGRVEVWYATFTDGSTGDGGWVHYETVAPEHAPPYGHGWIALFPADGSPVCQRFGPEPVRPGGRDIWFDVAGCSIGPQHLVGAAGAVTWDLHLTGDAEPLFTFPRLAWERQLLPGCQIVPWPVARFTGTVSVGGEVRTVGAQGAVARIYGHGNAHRWGWLHADLGGGEVLEIVTAVARRPGLRALPPTAMVQLRLAGEPDWPRNPLVCVLPFRTRLGLPQWSVRGTLGRHRLTVDVALPADRCVALTYTDPDGATATCTNSERADATILLERRDRTGWVEERRWELAGTAHAEVGTRP